ncbi:restriction endonuclease subunit S [Streptococcus mitis]|uniref:restriction endonuclease subunit S n=1 Tax=Streptococcus mitis TaxID=28037 RepID=UPI0025540C9A|nr:restriction endonuclease subunit S [Streptococcus mitis]MDK6636793.1 restriction endonuclease subunit S [Streptococcus mitis]MDK7133339.1 restriction endonuclease subunit S [Streptococcus mitis]
MTKKPSYRLAGYTEPWERRKLGEISSRVKGNDGRMDLPTLTISAGQGWLDQRERFSGNIAGKEQKNYTLLRKGELSYNHGNSKLAKYGVVFQLNNYTEALVPKVYHSFKMIDGRSGTFFEYLFATKIPDRELGKLVSSGARMDGLLNITYDDFMSIKLTFPKNNEEQTAIGSFFQDIDQLISLQQRKLEVLKEQKKTYLKLLFPAKGQKKPALRFAGFEDEWTSVLLGDISELYQPKTVSSEELLTEGFPVFGANGYIGYYKDYNHKEDQVTISARGEGTGTPSFVEGPVWITGNSMVVNVEKQANIIKPFLYAFCLSFDFKPFVTGGAQPQLTREVLKKVNIMLPSLPEQQAIGSFFQDLDKAIAKQEEKVNQLKESKQTLLRKMFI